MGIRLKVSGADAIYLDERYIEKAKFHSETADDSNARATDCGVAVEIWGKMLFSLGAQVEDKVVPLLNWSQVPSHKSACYRNLNVEVVSASQVVRSITLPDAFVIDYKESLDDETGVGNFYLYAAQKRDENAKVTIEGGFGAADE